MAQIRHQRLTQTDHQRDQTDWHLQRTVEGKQKGWRGFEGVSKVQVNMTKGTGTTEEL